MLPLKAFVNPLQHVLRYADGLVRAFPFLDGCLKYHDAGFVLEKPPDRLGVQVPECRNLGCRVVTLGGWSRAVDQSLRMRKSIRRCHLSGSSCVRCTEADNEFGELVSLAR